MAMQTADRRLLHGNRRFPARPDTPAAVLPAAGDEGGFERIAWLYGFLREYLFRDDSDHIERSLRATGWSPVGTTLLEIGCGPGVYARQLAARCPDLHTVGIDRSPTLVALARERAGSEGLDNCRFEQGDALALDWPDRSVDAVVTSRLLTVVDAPGAISEIHRVLRPGGRYFLAEPASVTGTVAPFAALRFARWLTGPQAAAASGTTSDQQARRLGDDELASAIQTRPWGTLDITTRHGYHYIVCQKPTEQAS